MGLKKKPSPSPTLNAAELQLIEQLRKFPELFERVHSILEITASAEGHIRKADEIEALLIQEKQVSVLTIDTQVSRC